MAKREIQEINAGSMADIAFLLLIFFLVSTTMDTDMGIITKLPPMPEEKQQDEKVDVKERNIFVVLVNRDDKLLVEGEQMDIKDLRQATKNFILNPYDEPDLPVKEIVDVPFFGPMELTTKHVISLQNDRGTSYKMYIAVQNELNAAINDLRDEFSLRKFGVRYDDLEDQDKIAAVETVVPRKVSEAEPRNIGGK